MSFPIVAKSELVFDEASSRISNVAREVSSFNVKGETKMYGFQGNTIPHFDVEIKTENEDKSQITRQLVEFFQDSADEDQKLFQITKHEEFCGSTGGENHSDNPTCFDDSAAAPTKGRTINNQTSDKPSNRSQTSAICDANGSLKLFEVSVKLVDLFSSRARKLGKSHRNTEQCLCIYCRGEYRFSRNEFRDNLQYSRNVDLMASEEKQNRKGLVQPKRLSVKFEDRDSSNDRNSRKNYTCKYCPKRFVLMSSLYSHWQEHHGLDKPFKCERCPKKFWFPSALETHLRVHTNKRPFKCKQCSAKFTQRATMHAHMRTHSEKRPFRCAQCPANFKFKSNLTVHLRVHSGDKPFRCKQCPAKFLTRTNLKRHSRVHSGEKPYECELCCAKFTQSSGLQRHLRLHRGEKPYGCALCSSRFAQRSTLRVHIRAHGNERPHKCEQCPAKFKEKCTLNTHLRVHSGERPFKCTQCPAKFKWKPSYNAHLMVHSGATLFSCAHCSTKFKKKLCLVNHLNKRSCSRRSAAAVNN